MSNFALLRVPFRVALSFTLVAVFVGLMSTLVYAGDTGTISGTITDATAGTPIAGAKISAAAPSAAVNTTTDAKGFFVLQNLPPDTYTISVEATGYSPSASNGINVFQDQTTDFSPKIAKSLRTIGSAKTSAQSVDLVNPRVGSDTYNVTGPLLNSANGGDHQSETLYTFLATVPGVTVSGGVGAPRIRGGDTHDIGYEFDGIPIRERLFGLFTTNITDVGLGNIEVTTGGMGAQNAGQGAGIINSVAKTGTYPASGAFSFGMTGPDFNNYYSAEFGGQTQDRKFSYYLASGVVRSNNQYNYGNDTYLNLIGGDISGPVNESDLVGNFHFKPTTKDDIQFLFQNGVADFDYNYLLPGPGQPQALELQPCAGYTYNPNGTGPAGVFGASGGTAPNGQSCPTGMYWKSINGMPNVWYHYSGLGKIQWNRQLDAHSSFALRFAENYNEYIFEQPLADENEPQYENPGGYLNKNAACPLYPYADGSPVQPLGASNYCGYDYQSFYGDRKSHMYFGSLDYTNYLSENLTLKAGVSQEYDVNLLNYVGLDSFSYNGSYPNESYSTGGGTYSDVPTHVPAAYAEANIQAHKLLLSPGLFWSRIWYGAPAVFGGSQSAGVLNPTFSSTYQFSKKDVLRGSYGQASSFVGSAYLFRQSFDSTGHWVANPYYNPSFPGCSSATTSCPTLAPNLHLSATSTIAKGPQVAPEFITNGDFMWEHAFDSNTSLKFGPYWEQARNYYVSYSPITQISPNGTITTGPATKSSLGRHHAFGAEFAFYRTDPRPVGFDTYLTATYDNYWSSSTTLLTSSSPLFTSLPEYYVDRNILVRNSANPLVTATLTGDYHTGRFDWSPQLFYQFDTFYGGGLGATPKTGGPPPLLPTSIAGGWYLLDMTFREKLGVKKDYILGIRAKNLLDQGNSPTPCQVPLSGDTHSGCAGVNGPYSGVGGTTPGEYIYQPIPNYFSPYPQSFEVFVQKNF